MAVYSFYLFDRAGTCLCYYEWRRRRQPNDSSDDQKNMFGMLFALRNFSMKLSPDGGAQGIPRFFVTDVYALHYLESATGLRFVLTTSSDFGGADVATCLQDIYEAVYVKYVAKNPLYVRGKEIKSQFFLTKLDDRVRALPCF